jgi:hypothetical protein
MACVPLLPISERFNATDTVNTDDLPFTGLVGNTSNWWQFAVESITADGDPVATKVQGFYDSGAAFMPTKSTDTYLANYFDTAVTNDGTTLSYADLQHAKLDCDYFDNLGVTLPTLEFEVNGFTVTLSPFDYFPAAGGQCSFGLNTHGSGLDDNIMIFGQQFFLKYVVTIDWRGDMQVGFALRSDYKGNATQMPQMCDL